MSRRDVDICFRHATLIHTNSCALLGRSHDRRATCLVLALLQKVSWEGHRGLPDSNSEAASSHQVYGRRAAA